MRNDFPKRATRFQGGLAIRKARPFAAVFMLALVALFLVDDGRPLAAYRPVAGRALAIALMVGGAGTVFFGGWALGMLLRGRSETRE